MATSPTSPFRALAQIAGLLFQTDNLTAETIRDIAAEWEALIKNWRLEVSRVKNFKFNPHWKTRVINATQATEQIKDLIAQLTSGVADNLALIQQPFQNIHAELTALAELSRLPREPGESALLRGFQDLQAFVNALNTLLREVLDALRAAQRLRDLFDRLLSDAESLDDVFLPQSGRRKFITKKRFARIHS